jgi:DNA-binding response OmpR family regulator
MAGQSHPPVALFGQLFALHEDIQPQEYTFSEATCILGRSQECHIVIPRITVSRVHAQIERKAGRHVLSDAGSVNGTFINSRRIAEPHLLNNHDVIGLGSTTALLRFVDPDPTVGWVKQLVYDERTMTFFLKQQKLNLPPTIFRLLLHLYQHAGQVCDRESCAQAIWGRNYNPELDTAALDRALTKLRSHIREIDPDREWIQTRRGVGYMLDL